MFRRLLMPVLVVSAAVLFYSMAPPPRPKDPIGWKESLEKYRSGPSVEFVITHNHEKLENALDMDEE